LIELRVSAQALTPQLTIDARHVLHVPEPAASPPRNMT